MTEHRQLSVSAREQTGKGATRALRRAAFVPATLYGGDEAAASLSLSSRDLTQELEQGGFYTRIYDLNLDGKKIRALPRDVQHHPVSGAPYHVDFMRVTDRTKIRVWVPVHFANEETCVGLREGGVLNIVRHEIEMHCTAGAIPSELVVDLVPFALGDSIHIDAVDLPQGVRPVIERNFTIATIAAPSALRSEAEEAAEAEAAEAEAGEGAETPEAGEGQAEEGKESA
jgi:large subunit ribosomal protein L25